MIQPVEPLLQWLDAAKPFVLALLTLGAILVAGGHAVMWKRDPRAALGWLGLILVLPVAGPALYAVFGINRLSRKAQTLYSSHDSHPLKASGVGADAEAVSKHKAKLEELGLVELDALVSRTVPEATKALLQGNRVVPLHTGAAAYDAMLGAIAMAERSVTMATYIFDDDPAGGSWWRYATPWPGAWRCGC